MKNIRCCFFVGDFETNGGPANANRKILEALSDYTRCYASKSGNKFIRIIELLRMISKSDVIIICSASRINYYVLRISRFFNKPVAMIVHGKKAYEYRVSMGDSFICDKKYLEYQTYEQNMIDKVDRIFCVSQMHMEDLKSEHMKNAHKISYINNIVALNDNKTNNIEKDLNLIISIGGGVRQKNNLTVAKAIQKLNSEYNLKLKYLVIGKPELDGDELVKFDFVEMMHYLPHETVLEKLSSANLYVQNSIYDTFGLSVLEALFSGASILISQNVGCKDVFDGIEEGQIIMHTYDVDEIANKLLYVLKNPNHDYMMSILNRNDISREFIGKKLFNELNDLIYEQRSV